MFILSLIKTDPDFRGKERTFGKHYTGLVGKHNFSGLSGRLGNTPWMHYLGVHDNPTFYKT